MLAAQTTFTAPYGGEHVTIGRGEWCAADHELVRRFPDRFAPTPPAPQRAEQHTRRRAPARPTKREPLYAGRPAWQLGPAPTRTLHVDVKITDGTARTPIRLARSAWDTILDEARRADGRIETGGLLFGPSAHTTSYSGVISVQSASGPGPKARHTPNRFRPDQEHDVALAHRTARNSGGQVNEIGSWHTHPDPGSTGPSSLDLAHWASLRAVLDARRVVSRYTAIIVTPHRDHGWTQPEGHAWIVTPNQRGHERAQRARLSTATP